MATLENTYFLRSFLLLVEGGSYIVRTIIKRECQKKEGNLDKLLQDFEKKLKHEFHGKQYQKLFPASGCTDINKWDLQLLIGVVTIVFRTSLLKHEKKELVVLKQLRNEVYMHCSSAALDDDKYDEIKEQLEDSITILASTFEDSVQECCSKYIKQFISGPLDAVRPSIATLNGVSQTCLKKVNVGVHTELAVVGPSDCWIGLCEQTLDTVFNSAITGSEGDEFEEIKKKVNKMLEFLLANKEVVLKDCTKACVVLSFECNTYDDSLFVLNQLDSWEYRYHLNKIANALTRKFQLNCLLTITSRVTTECLQSILIHYIKMMNDEETESRLEISSEIKTDNTGEEKTQQGADEIKIDDRDEDKTGQGADDTACLTTESAQPLLLDLECTSKEGLLHILNAFKGDELQLHMKSIADALSAHFNQKITLKTSLNLKEFMEAFEEAAIADSRVDRVLIEDVSDAGDTPLELEAEIQEIQEIESPRKETLLGTSVKDVSEDSEEVRTVDDYYIFFRGISPDTKKETLASFMEVTTNGAVVRDKIILSYTKTSALVTVSFDQNPDLRSVEDKIQKMGIDGENPEVYEVPPPESIAVSSEEDIINMECLVLYFESRKIGGVEVKQDPYKSEDGSCIVIQFGDPDIVRRICTKDTTYLWEGKRLRVSPFFKCKAGEIWDSEIHTLKIPEPVLVKFRPNILVLLQRECCRELLTELKKNHCVPTFSEQGLELECTLTPTVTGFKSLAKDWEKSSKHIVDSYISNNILEKSFESSANVWTELIKYFKTENLHECEELVTSVDDSNFVILLTGLRNTVEQLLQKLEAKETEIEKRLGRQTENIVFDAPRLRLLRSTGVFEEVKLEMKDIQLHIGEGEVAIEGQSEDINVVKLKLYEVSHKIVQNKFRHGFSKECVNFIQRNLMDKLASILKNRCSTIEWKIDMRNVNVYAFEQFEDAVSADNHGVLSEHSYAYLEDEDVGTNPEDILKSAVVEIQENVQDSSVSRDIETFLAEMEQTYGKNAEIQFNESSGKLNIYGMKKEVMIVQSKVKDFLEGNSVTEKIIETGFMEVSFIKRHREDLVSRLEKKYEVKIYLNDEVVTIKGKKSEIMDAEKELKGVCDGILCEKYTIQKVGVKVALRDEEKRGTLTVVENSAGCLIKLPDEKATVLPKDTSDRDVDGSDGCQIGPGSIRGPSISTQDDFGLATNDVPKERAFIAPNGIKVTLVKGELGKQKGDVIVAGTSPNLNLSSGSACKSLLIAGGQCLQEECKMKYPNHIEMDEIAVICDCGSLACNQVFLTSLPKWSFEDKPRQVLQTVVNKSLKLASEKKMNSIVFCAMGTGQLNYPKDLVAFLMYQTVIEFDQSYPETTLKDVRFVLYHKDVATVNAFEEEERLRLEGSGSSLLYDLKAGNMVIELSVEHITEQKVDGILCPTCSHMDLSHNGVGRALLRVGGKPLQDECKSKYRKNLEKGHVTEIGAEKLCCKSLFLAVLPGCTGDTECMTLPNLTYVIQTVLYKAQARGHSSLALPVLWPFESYPVDEVCTRMFEAVTEWAKKNRESSVQTVKFVMHPKDIAVIQRFESYVLTAEGLGRRDNRQSSDECEEPSARLKSLAQQQSIYKPDWDGVTVGKIKFSVYKDDLFAQRTDAIVSSVGKDFLFIGAVAHELKRKCPAMEMECRQRKDLIQKLNTEGVVVTKASGLCAKSVIHVRFANNLSEWRNRMYKCLEVANNKSYRAIAFPVLGTGQGYKSFGPDEVAGCLFEAIKVFEHSYKTHSIEEVRLIVYKKLPGMFSQIKEMLLTKMNEPEEKAIVGMKELSTLSAEEDADLSESQLKQPIEDLSSIEVHIYSDSRANVERCKAELDSKVENMYTEWKIEKHKETIKTFTKAELREIDLPTLAKVNIDPQLGIITIYGPTEKAADVTNAIKTNILEIDKRHEFKAAEDLYNHVQWQYEEVTTVSFKLVPYHKRLNQRIEQAYKEQLQSFQFEENGDSFVIDFIRFIEYRKSDEQNRLRVLRKDMLEVLEEPLTLPDAWTEMTFEDVENRFISEVESNDYRNIFNGNNITVSKVERIERGQTESLYRLYQAKKGQMLKQKSSLPEDKPIERDLWHATSSDTVSNILKYGFNRGFCGKATGDALYGEGVYFAGDASHSIRRWLSSAGSCRKGYIFLAKVLSGKMCQGKKGMRYLSENDTAKSTLMYDCAVDDEQNPREFILFNDTQAYPVYIITFHYSGSNVLDVCDTTTT
ncbi:protein mono-ADP-ribosyltransferase PARP14-like isoform X2 [Mercenaria mercenaria]|uniref:protein mono-ADP-ribosyltransferase PARP14-like isoform X2 n=1 Tax=Mercenaria mercenaria TaxID=6596 RepID=UPI00234F20B0|nr:protein mono-ADP-ribosyltransferase PARP14-like isoform X2 [Mercenaria mercenaria]